MPRRDDGKVDEDRSYGFVVVPCVRRNFPQCRRLSVRDEATRQNGTGRDGTRRDAGMRRVASRRDAAPAHRVAPTYVHIPRTFTPLFRLTLALPFRIRNRTFPRYLRRDITRSLLRRDGIFKWHAHWGV